MSQDDKATGLPGPVPLGPRGPSLRLDSDQELMDAAAAFGWSGNGSRTSPFIIEDLVKDGSPGGSGIYLGNTTLHVEIRNCTLLRTSSVIKNYGEGAGITLFAVSNVSINGCNASSNSIGFHIIASHNVSVEGSDISWNYMYGIHVTASDDIFIESSIVEYNDYGIYVTDSNNVSVTGSHCHDNDDHGVRLDNSHNCKVLNSTFEMNDDGVNLMSGSTRNNISSNVMSDCRESAIAIGDAENNYFHGNIMTNCSFYFPLEPLTVRFNMISRTNRVGGKDVLFIHGVVAYDPLKMDLVDIGQLIIVSSSRLILSNMSADRGSQAIVLKGCSELSLTNITISNQTFHAMIAYNSPETTLTNCTISDCYNGIEGVFSNDLTFIGVIIEKTISPLSLTNVKRLFMDRCKMMNNEHGISFGDVRSSYISELTSVGCGNADVRTLSTEVSLIGCFFNSKWTVLDLEISTVVSYASSYEMMSNLPIISAKRGSVSLLNNTFRTARIINEPTFHPFKTVDQVSFVMEGNELLNFGLLPDQVFPVSGKAFVVGPDNKVNGRPLLFLQGRNMEDLVLSEPYGQIFLKDVSNLHISNQSFNGSCVGLATSGSTNIAVSNSTLSGCIWGMSVLRSTNVNIGSCIFSSNKYGIHFGDDRNSFSVVEGSSFFHNKVGCILDSGHAVKVRNNTFVQNQGTAISVRSGSFNAVYDNLLMDNLGPGVMIEGGPGGNLIFRNAFIRNNGSGPDFSPSKLQGYDKGTDQWSRDRVGNFWYDKTGPDADGDLMVDEPYPLLGGKNFDPTPLARIPASILPPPTGILVTPKDEFLLVRWDISKGGLLPATGFRLYLNRILLWEGGSDAREAWLAFKDLPYGSITMTSLCEFGEGDASLPVPSRNETEPPEITWLNRERKELTSIKDSLKFMVRDGSGINNVLCSIDRVPHLSWDRLDGDLIVVPLQGLSEGPHTVNVSAYDLFWNGASIGLDIIIDDSPPLLALELPGNGTLFNTLNLEVLYSVTDMVGTVASYELRLDGETLVLKDTAGTVLLRDLMEGEHTLELLAVDTAGNQGSMTLRFELDLTPPRVLSYSPQGSSIELDPVIEVEVSEPLVRNASITLNWIPLSFETYGNVLRTPKLDLRSLTTYMVRVSGRDAAGNYLYFEWMFRTTSIAPSSAVLRGRTVDKDGRPLKDAAIWVDGSPVTNTRSNGSFELRISEGNHTLRIERIGFRPRLIPVSVVQGEERDLGDIELEKIAREGKDQGLWLLVLAALAMVSVLIIAVVVSALRGKDDLDPSEE